LTGTARHTPSQDMFSAMQCILETLQHPGLKSLKSYQAEMDHSLQSLVEDLGVPSRHVTLRGRWWRRNGGPLLVSLDDNSRIAAAIPKTWGGYDIIAPARKEHWRVRSGNAGRVQSQAMCFYPSLPDKGLTFRQLVQFSIGRLVSYLWLILITSALASLVSMAIPWGASWIFDELIPTGSQPMLFQLCGLLAAICLAGWLFGLARSFSILALQGRISGDIQVSIWDRLLKIPPSFFRKFGTGDLLLRATSAETITRMLSGNLLEIVFAGFFSFFYFFLLFHFSPVLTGVALLLLVVAALPLMSAVIKIPMQRQFFELEGNLSNRMLEMVRGIAKLRASAAEGRAFSEWNHSFRQRCILNYRIGLLDTLVGVWNSGFHLFSMLAIYSTVMVFLPAEQRPTTGSFIGFLFAYGAFLTSTLAMLNTSFSLLALVPIYERAKPLLTTQPERDSGGLKPPALRGEIAVENLCFGYGGSLEKVLDDVSFRVEPGEFVAIIGPSGAGKSTLLRLLLGFEKATSGTIAFDGLSLDSLDLKAFRAQLGVVLQDSRPLPGTILQNLSGTDRVDRKQIWEALEQAGLKTDVEHMPMGIHTFVAEGGGTLSGGQAQRLLIAKALIHQPRLLLFDEATSALDNKAQAIVTEHIATLKLTRLVVAHRLSTIARADRILVFEKGRLVQNGSYQQLMNQPGLFRQLARKQEL